ncbi:MAG: hypothetical protein ACRDGS_12005 [Chloroflexota bacterium]
MAPSAFVRLVAVTAILAAPEGPVTTLFACIKAALLGSRRLEGPPTLLPAFLTPMALSTAAGALIIAAEPAPTTRALVITPKTAGPFVIPAETPATTAAAGIAAARSATTGALVIPAETPASLIGIVRAHRYLLLPAARSSAANGSSNEGPHRNAMALGR